MRNETEIRNRLKAITVKANHEREWADTGKCDEAILKEEEILEWVLNDPTPEEEIKRLRQENKHLREDILRYKAQEKVFEQWDK